MFNASANEHTRRAPGFTNFQISQNQQWFAATVTRYNSLKNQILLSYEDEDEKWHRMDFQSDELTQAQLIAPDFEGTLDNKKIKYRIVALTTEGEGAVRRFGDESDFDAEDGIAFPPIPPAPLPTHLPKLVCNTQVSLCLAFYGWRIVGPNL